ncbi:hypothetical protein QE392_000904 [Microbacterium proteolyticum]|nr:hypothetical protein [Microbacterium proteolyticum]
MTSGEPSGLRVNDWKIAPERASATPHASAKSARGNRHPVTRSVVWVSAVPMSAEATWARLSGYVPTETATIVNERAVTPRTVPTIALRRLQRPESRPRRKMRTR